MMASLCSPRRCRRCGRLPAPAAPLASVAVEDYHSRAVGEDLLNLVEKDYHGRPISLRIKLPKRTRWPAYDEHAKQLIVEKARRGLNTAESIRNRSEKLRIIVELYHELIAQPLLLASHPTFRLTAINRREEISREVRDKSTFYDEDWFEVEYAWDNLMAELPDHPLYKEE